METVQRKALVWMLATAASLTAASYGQATTIICGSGEHSAQVYLEFGDGACYEFDVYFSGQTTGLGLMDIIEADTTLTTIRDNHGWGVFVDGIAYDGHSNGGYLGGENWWHYWTQEVDTGVWQPSMMGAVDRVVVDGGGDGWIYGRAGSPTPEPASLALVATWMFLLRRRRIG